MNYSASFRNKFVKEAATKYSSRSTTKADKLTKEKELRKYLHLSASKEGRESKESMVHGGRYKGDGEPDREIFNG